MTRLKDKAKKLKLDIPTVYIALKKKETPIIAKFFALFTVIYTLSFVGYGLYNDIENKKSIEDVYSRMFTSIAENRGN